MDNKTLGQSPADLHCELSEDEVLEYILDLSEGEDNPVMKQHIQCCCSCGKLFERFRAAERAVAGPSDSVEQPVRSAWGPVSIPGYEVVELCGEGGMASVWKARRVADGATVALKLLSRRLTPDPQFTQRFYREADIGAKLDHPNLVKCLEVGEVNGCYFMALEYVDGQDLAAVLSQRSSLPEGQALAITAAAALGMEHAHARGLIHRDLKPNNLILTRSGQIKVADFGLARCDAEGLRLTVSGAVMGTPHYISPEQIECKIALDARSDMYSLGCSLFHMLTGRPPFLGRNMYDILTAHVSHNVPDPRSINPTISPETATLVLWMCAHDRERRLSSMGRLVQAIGRTMGLPSAQNTPYLPTCFSNGEIELDLEEPKTTAEPIGQESVPPDLTLQIPTQVMPMELPSKGGRLATPFFAVIAALRLSFRFPSTGSVFSESFRW